MRAGLTAVACLLASPAKAIVINATSDASTIRSAARSIATEMMGYYVGNQPGQTPGYLPGSGQPGGYFWWVGGGMFGTMVNYWYRTGDTTWNDEVAQAIYFQSDPGSGGFFDSANVSLQLGNDDQAFWALAAMEAAEYKFLNPPAYYPSWLAMAQGVFNQQAQRWDDTTCGGGLRWQVFPFNSGYNYKNSISNGCFFNLGARLGKYTGNTTYVDLAIRSWNWSVSADLIGPNYTIIDGIVEPACDSVGHTERWSYNLGVYLYGAAAIWNITQSSDIPGYASQASLWQTRVTNLFASAQFFLKNDTTTGLGVVTEVICEPQNTCQVDGSTFKAYLIRWMAVSAQVAPFLAANTTNFLAPSVAAAGNACTAPPTHSSNGTTCGQEWYTGSFDGRTGIGMQMTALEVIQTLLDTPGPVTIAQGISASDPSAGALPAGKINGTAPTSLTLTTGDRAGAILLTIVFATMTLVGGWWALDPKLSDVRTK